ncbi:MAG TPA: hypothetical protein VMU80_08835, partial [Bryobacteraceae bacterium]|nr:hypothetical protein [Bryobacteraceae bacterium]
MEEHDMMLSVPGANFARNLIELFEFISVMTIQVRQINIMTRKFVATFKLFPIELRRQFIPDDKFDPVDELVKKGVG